MAGGGGGDGGASARASEDRARKEAATNDVNAIFCIDPTGTAPKEPVKGPKYKSGNDAEWNRWKNLKESAARNNAAREAMYGKNSNAVFDFNKSKLDRDAANADREERFALARTGLMGGSVDIQDKDKMNLAYDTGTLQARNAADQAGSNFRSADENARLNVINQIQSGVDSGSALASAQKGLENSANAANATATGKAIGNVFDDAGLLYSLRAQDQGITNARKLYQDKFGSLFPNTTSYSGTVR